MTALRSIVLGVGVASLVGSGVALKASDDERVPESVTVSFGAGLNTVGATNHHILPQTITVRMTPATATTAAIPGVVNFAVGGFHQIFVYNPGVTPADITAFLAINDPTNAKLFINRTANLFYTGINPLRNAAGVAGEASFPTVNGSVVNGNDNGTNNILTDDIPPGNRLRVGFQNRVESVGFTTPGMYLVICNVRPHFQDGMMAWVNVVTGVEEEDKAEAPEAAEDHSGHGGH
jgi:hypothetical protein